MYILVSFLLIQNQPHINLNDVIRFNFILLGVRQSHSDSLESAEAVIYVRQRQVRTSRQADNFRTSLNEPFQIPTALVFMARFPPP